jgi:hypothetical protein
VVAATALAGSLLLAGELAGSSHFQEYPAREAILLPLFYERDYRFVRPEVEGLQLNISWPTVAYEKRSVGDETGRLAPPLPG